MRFTVAAMARQRHDECRREDLHMPPASNGASSESTETTAGCPEWVALDFGAGMGEPCLSWISLVMVETARPLPPEVVPGCHNLLVRISGLIFVLISIGPGSWRSNMRPEIISSSHVVEMDNLFHQP